MIEQRRTQRFQLKLPLRILRAGIGAVAGNGETVNVSSRGVLFSTDRRLDVGESIEYAISLPLAGSADGPDLRCLGKVLRYEGSIANPGHQAKLYIMAATIERHEFVRD